MSGALSPSARRVQDALAACGLDCRIVEHEASSRTSADAAALLGCSVAQIAKSLVFRRVDAGGGAVLVIASGGNRVDEAKVAAIVGSPVARPDAAYVREVTGYAIGGIPPLGHASPMPVLVDEDLLRHPVVYAAGGTPNALFPVAPADLVRASGGRVADVALGSGTRPG